MHVFQFVVAPDAVRDLRVMAAVTHAGTRTATLGWTPLIGAITTTIRYASSPITEADWLSATLLTSAQSGSLSTYVAVVPDAPGTTYWAKSQDAPGDWSALSNNAFWPQHKIYLPLVMRESR